MQNTEQPLQRWEIGASAVATALVTIAAIVQEDTAVIQTLMRQLKVTSWWLSAIIAVPLPVWWLLTAITGAAAFWAGLVLARRRGAPFLFLAPALMLLLQFAVPWLLLGPIRAVAPAIGR